MKDYISHCFSPDHCQNQIACLICTGINNQVAQYKGIGFNGFHADYRKQCLKVYKVKTIEK